MNVYEGAGLVGRRGMDFMGVYCTGDVDSNFAGIFG